MSGTPRTSPDPSRTHVLTSLLALATLAVAAQPALATHNSLGANAYVAVADEVTASGELSPDIPRDPHSALRFRWHTSLSESTGGLLPARLDPPDQSGDRYDPTRCEPFGQGTQYATWTAYDDALRKGQACYVGYLDAQWEYRLSTHALLIRQPDDPLYGLNPSRSDETCNGQDADGIPTPLGPAPPTGVQAIDRLATYLLRSVVDGFLLSTGPCSGSGHGQYLPGHLAVDSDLLEPPAEAFASPSDDPYGLAQPGSGYNTLPLAITPYVFLFGQPHPDTPEANRSQLSAWDSVFDLAFPGVVNPCGDRTRACDLLSPEDIVRYDDTDAPHGPGATQARVCDHRPQFITINPDERAAGACGPLGRLVDGYIGPTNAGGLGIQEITSGAPTWLNTLPGWYEGTLILTLGSLRSARSTADAYTGLAVCEQVCVSSEDHTPESPTSLVQYVSVNPSVPTLDHALWCVRPNLLAQGDDTLLPGTTSDPGFYGTYRAHAIDVDVYTAATRKQHDAVLAATHAPVRNGTGPPAPIPDSVLGVPVDADRDGRLGLRDAERLVLHAQNATRPDNDGWQDFSEAYRRAYPLEAPDRDPDHVTPATPASHAERFDQVQQAGLACDGSGSVRFVPWSSVLAGGLRLELRVDAGQFEARDMTATGSDGLPRPGDETRRNGWQATEYRFSGSITARADTNGNGRFDACSVSDGQPQPERDACPWRALWDAYNRECTDIQGTRCGALLDAMGYDRETGVGLLLVVHVHGPAAVWRTAPSSQQSEDAVRLIGLERPIATHCIVGTSRGLDLGKAGPSGLASADADAVLAHACDGTDGERLVIEDAFADQDGVRRGGFQSSVRVVKLAPTPDGLDDVSPQEGIVACVRGIWSVQDGRVAEDTARNLALEGRNVFEDCDRFDNA